MSDPPSGFVHVNDLVVAREYEAALRDARLDCLESLFAARGEGSLDKPGLGGWRERVRLTLRVGSAERAVFLKRFRHPPGSARRRLRRARNGGRTHAGVEWRWLQEVSAAGIACPRAIALGEEMAGRREVRSVVLMQGVGGDALERWVRRWTAADRETVRELIVPAADLVGRFHAAGFVHRDLYLSHVFYDPAAGNDGGLSLIDLARVMRPRWRQLRWIVKDLAALDYSTPGGLVSRTERLRWLTRYLRVSKLGVSRRRMVGRVVAKSRRIARHDGKARRQQGSGAVSTAWGRHGGAEGKI